MSAESAITRRLNSLLLGICEKLLTGIAVFTVSHKSWLHVTKTALNRARLSMIQSSLESCGTRISVQFPITITGPEKVRLGDDVSLAAYVHIWGGGGVSIGDRVMIGTHTSISSLTHDYSEKAMFNTFICRPIVIEDDVWIGSNCVILPGVRVGQGAVVGAGSVVTRDVEPNTIVVGVPARKIKIRR